MTGSKVTQARKAGALPLAGRREVRAWVWQIVTTQRAGFVGMLALFIAAAVAGLVGPRLLGELVESVRPGAPTWRIDLIALVFLAVLLVETVLHRFAQFVAAVFGERLLADAREGLVHHSMRLPLDVVEAAGTGELLGRATTDVDKLDEGLRMAAPRILVASVMVVLTMVAMVITSPLLALGGLVSVPILVLASRWYRPKAVPTYERTLGYWAQVHASTHETVTGARTVEALGLAERRIAHQHGALRRVAAGEQRTARLWSCYMVALDSAALAPIAVLLLLGTWAYQQGLVGIGTVAAMVLYAGALSGPMSEVLSWMDELQIGAAALRRVLGVRLVPLQAEDSLAEPEGRALRLRGVRFGYRPDREVLRGIDLDIEPGERIAVVGPSGSGKSTLGRLLAGINNPDHGTVHLGGVPVGALPLERRRQEIVLVTQEQHVFGGTVRDNLTLSGPASDEQLWSALRAVGAGPWADGLSDGLDTLVGSGGDQVPPSVTQQIALARLLLADPHTLVLDEATSLLDPSASRELERSLAAVLDDRTVVMITHQLETARAADRIVVLEQGRVIEHGSHEDLITADGSYAALVKAAAG